MHPDPASPLLIPEQEIRRHGPGNLLAVCWRQWWAERALARRGIHFRSADPAIVQQAYTAMTPEEFDAINGRQDWANWRTIPRALSGHVPDRALRVLDLGCGTGSSTRVLAYYCPAGSRITGFELAAPLIEVGRRRSYCRRSGEPVDVSFVCQGMTETFQEDDHQPVPPTSVDLVSASGVVGHHLNSNMVVPVAQEIRRVLRPGGTALLDVGPTMKERSLTRLMEPLGFRRLGRRRSWLFDPTGQVVFQLHDKKQ